MDDEVIQVCALTARVACQQMTARHLKALGESIEQACCLPAQFCWDRKATAYAEVINLLADAAADPVIAMLARDAPGHLHDLMVTIGPAADGIIASSRRRLLELVRNGDADGAKREMERHLGYLSWIRRQSRAAAEARARRGIAV